MIMKNIREDINLTIRLSNEAKEMIKAELKNYFEQERGEEIGDLATEILFDFINKNIGLYYYNQGVKDAIRVLNQNMMSLEEDIEALVILKR
jgi:uncharacterized protein (DUF2164 family)